MLKLLCLSGMNKGDEYFLSEGENTFGRSDKNSICVYDIKSSRRHGIFIVAENEVFLEDLNSTNGTKLNNVNITKRMKINVGDHIRIGQTVFVLAETADAEGKEVNKPKPIKDNIENLIQNTSFQVTTTTSLSKMKKRNKQKADGAISFFDNNS